MKAPSKLRGHAGADPDVMEAVNRIEDPKISLPEADSDSEYEAVPKKSKVAEIDASPQPVAQTPAPPAAAMDVDELVASGAAGSDEKQDIAEDTSAGAPTGVTDDDWMRSRTSRLLGIVDDDEEEEQSGIAPTTAPRPIQQDKVDSDFEGFGDDEDTKAVAPPETTHDDDVETTLPMDQIEEKIRQSQRLYLRNLSYNVTEDDLRSSFESFGNLDEVSYHSFRFSHTSHPFQG